MHGNVWLIVMQYDERSNKVRATFTGPGADSDSRSRFEEVYEPSKLPSALYDFAKGLQQVTTGAWS